MPRTLSIPRAWKHEGEPNRIHYIVLSSHGHQYHLYEDKGSRLYQILLELISEDHEVAHPLADVKVSSRISHISFSVHGANREELLLKAEAEAIRFFAPPEDHSIVVKVQASPHVLSDSGIVSWEGDVDARLMGPPNPIGHEEVG